MITVNLMHFQSVDGDIPTVSFLATNGSLLFYSDMILQKIFFLFTHTSLSRVRNTGVVCAICSRILKDEGICDRHLQSHATTKYRCTLCGWMFHKHTVLRFHLTKVHGMNLTKKEVKRDFLNECFVENKNRTMPISTATCPTCGRVAMKGDMDDHLESHSEMWYKCRVILSY